MVQKKKKGIDFNEKVCYDNIGDKMKKNLIKNLLKSITLIFLFYESIWIQKGLVALFHIHKITPKIAVILNTISSLIFAIFLILIYQKELKREWQIFKNKLSENMDIGIKYWLFGLLGMMIANLIITFVLKAGQANNEQSVQKMITAYPLVMIISAGIIAPINEEILFRKCFKNMINNQLLFILISGIFFGLLHIVSATTFTQFLYIIPYSSLGIAFAIMYVKTDSVFTSMSMHMIHNTLLTLFSILSTMN